jgi:hypothetical protein
MAAAATMAAAPVAAPRVAFATAAAAPADAALADAGPADAAPADAAPADAAPADAAPADAAPADAAPADAAPADAAPADAAPADAALADAGPADAAPTDAALADAGPADAAPADAAPADAAPVDTAPADAAIIASCFHGCSSCACCFRERRHRSTRVPDHAFLVESLTDVAHDGWLCTFTIKLQLEIPSARSWSVSPVRATGTVRKRQTVRPVHHVQNHTCRVALLQLARRAVMVGQPSSLRPHWLLTWLFFLMLLLL